MTQNISGLGLQVQLFATPTFPTGFNITAFADDADPLDNPSQQLADVGMGVNGDMVTWNKANAIKATLNVIPGSDDDINLGILAEANRAGQGKLPVQDICRMVIVYPDGKTVTLTEGVVTDAMIATSVASAGRLKSKTYAFAFQNKAST